MLKLQRMPSLHIHQRGLGSAVRHPRGVQEDLEVSRRVGGDVEVGERVKGMHKQKRMCQREPSVLTARVGQNRGRAHMNVA